MRETTIFFKTIAFKTNRNFKALLFVFALLAQSNLFSGQIINNYLFSQSIGTYTPVTGGVDIATATDNSTTGNLTSGVYSVLLPFNFTFNNTLYPTNSYLSVSTKGFITFGSVAPTTALSAPFSSTTGFEGVIAAFAGGISSFANINGVTGKITYEVQGTAPNRVFVIEWQNFRPTASSSLVLVYSFSFQIKMYETSNNVAIMYSGGSFLAGSGGTISGSRQVGLRGNTTADYSIRTNTSTQNFSASTLATNVSSYQQINVNTTPPGMPDAGLTYLWQAPSCFPPSGIGATSVAQNSIDLSWVGSVSNPMAGYDVYYSTSNTAPNSSTILNSSNSVSVSSGNTASVSGLSTGTVYYFWIRSKCTTTDIGTWTANPYILATACSPVTTFFENFDSFNASVQIPNILPACWYLNIPTLSPGTQSIYTTNTNSTPNNLYFNTSSTQNPVIAVMPEFSNVNVGNRRIRFFGKVSSVGTGIEVGYMTNAADATTFNTIIVLPLSSTLSEYTVDIPTTIPTGARLAFKSSRDGKTYYIDDVYWEDSFLATNETLNGKKDLAFYPNPFTDYVNINTEKVIESFVISDTSGRTVKTIKNPTGKVFLGDLKSGLYFVKVKFEDGKTEIYKALKKD